MKALIVMVRGVNALSGFFSRVAGWFGFFLVLLAVEQVIARYFFNASSVALQELEWHLFGFLFLFGTAETLRKNEHVRVDVCYNRFPKRVKLVIDILGTTLFLIPVCLVVVWYGIHFVQTALSYQNSHAIDYYSTAWFAPATLAYQISAALEEVFRTYVLIGEISPDPGGLEGRWIIKAAIPFGFFLLFLQSLAELARKLTLLITQRDPFEDTHGS